jgi:uncharacterized protein YdaU (DUF1376 family)
MSFWTLGEDGRLHQKRLDEEWRKATERHVAVSEPRKRLTSIMAKTDRLNGTKS